MSGAKVSQYPPEEAWRALENSGDAVLVDVRTRPEWIYVGLPDLGPIGKTALTIEWRRYPDMQINPGFFETLDAALGPDAKPSEIYFICRSGARSMEAAMACAKRFEAEGRPVACVNVAEGFEGDLDERRRRGGVNGWKAKNLPWRQN